MEGKELNTTDDSGVFVHTPLFVAAAHELKSPLALVRQLALELESSDTMPQSARQIANQISLTSERALRLTTDLTKHARLEDSLFTLEPLNPVSLCDEVVEELRPLYRAKGRELRVRQRRGSLLGLANKDLLRRIMLSFADNALHYGDNQHPVEISVHATEGGQYLRLGVRDFGPAVPVAMHRRVDGGIGKAASTMSTRPASSGLGVYIARQFADAMQARIGTTRHRDGATFYVDIHASSQLRLL